MRLPPPSGGLVPGLRRARGAARLWIPLRAPHSSVPQTPLSVLPARPRPTPLTGRAPPLPDRSRPLCAPRPEPHSLTPSSWARNTPLASHGLSLRFGPWSHRPLGTPPAGWRGCPGQGRLEVRSPGCAVPTGTGDLAVPGEGAGESLQGWKVFRAQFHPLLALPQAG